MPIYHSCDDNDLLVLTIRGLDMMQCLENVMLYADRYMCILNYSQSQQFSISDVYMNIVLPLFRESRGRTVLGFNVSVDYPVRVYEINAT